MIQLSTTGWAVAVTNNQLSSALQPLLQTLIVLAGLIAGFFIVLSGVEYITSAGNYQRITHAKKVFKNAILGLILVIASFFILNFLNSAYSAQTVTPLQLAPPLVELQAPAATGLVEQILQTSVGILRHLVATVAEPFINVIEYLSFQTPLLGQNPVVTKLWLVVLGIANSLFVLVVMLLGLQLMSASSLGFAELDFKHLLPKLAAIFLLMNSSLFLIDILINLSNNLLTALWSAAGINNLWDSWSQIAQSGLQAELVSLLLMLVFVVLSACLLIYYILRLMVLSLGAVLAPVVILLQLMPLTKGITITAIKTYLMTIFILFIHGIILALATALAFGSSAQPSWLSLVIGIATLLLMLKAPKTISRWCQVNLNLKGLKHLSYQLVNGISAGLSQIRLNQLVRQYEQKQEN